MLTLIDAVQKRSTRPTYFYANGVFVEMVRRRLHGDNYAVSSFSRIAVREQVAMVLDSEAGLASFHGSEQFISTLIRHAITTGSIPLSVESIDAAEFRGTVVARGVHPLLPALWRMARDAPGEVSPMAPLTKSSQVRITRWPDIRIMAGRADDMRVCALLMQRSCTVSECATSLEMDPGEVQAIFNAAYLAGYACVEKVENRAELRERSQLRTPLTRLWKGVRHKLMKRDSRVAAPRH